MTAPSFIVYLGCRTKNSLMCFQKDTETRLDVVFYPGRPKGQPKRRVLMFKEFWDVDIGKLGKAEIKKMMETSIMNSETVSREYPVLAWDGGFSHLLDEDAKWKNAVKWKGWRV